MGNKTAQEIRETMIDELTFYTGIVWHLQGNLYPPFPRIFADACMEAVKACWEEDYDRQIELPDNRVGSASDIVDYFRLEWYIDAYDGVWEGENE